jgi:predicted dehydrogenase
MIADRAVQIGIVGTGGIAAHHLRGYLQAGEAAQVCAVADIDTERARQFAEPLGAKVFADYAEMFASADLDAVDICLPHHLHEDAIVQAAQKGLHVLCEKPLCVTLDEARAVREAVAAAGITLMCAHNQLFLPAVAHARQMIRDGVLGKIRAARTTDVFLLKVDADRLGWRARRATSGGGELIDTGYHPTYLLLHLVGSDPIEVTAILTRHRLSIEGEDTAHVLVRFADDTVGAIVTGWAYEPPGDMERFSVTGDEGSLWSDGQTLHHRQSGGQPEVVFDAGPEKADTYALECVDFVACLREGRRPLNTEVEGIKVLEIILGAYASAEGKRIAELEHL